jgi:hypothetical protein
MESNFLITLIYVDSDPEDTDAKQFALSIRKHPTINIYEPKIFHFRDIGRAINWINKNPPPEADGAYVVCWDVTELSLTSAEIDINIKTLYGLGVGRDCVIAMASSQQTDLLWTVLREKLGADQVINRQDAIRGIVETTIGESIASNLSQKASGPDKVMQLTLLNMEGQINTARADVEKLDRRIRRQVDANLPKKLEEVAAEMSRRLEAIETTIFPARDLSGAPSILTLLHSLRQMVASHAKELEVLDQDIGKLADITEARQTNLEKTVKELSESTKDAIAQTLKKIETINAAVDHKQQLKLVRNSFFYSSLGRVLTISGAVASLVLIARFAPDAAHLLGEIIKALS